MIKVFLLILGMVVLSVSVTKASQVQYKALIQTITNENKIELHEQLLNTNAEVDYAISFAQGNAVPLKNKKITKLYRCINANCEVIPGTYIGRAPF